MRPIDADDLLWCYEKRMDIERLRHRNHAYLKGVRDCIKDLESQPTIELERKKGKWLSHYDYCKRKGCTPSGLIAFWWCDRCEREARYRTNFCPNCGAEMERGVMTREEAVDTAFEALAKMEAIQKVIDMPFEWEQDDRRRYAKIVDIVRKDLYRRENNEK